MRWVSDNYKWLFDGVGVAVILFLAQHLLKRHSQERARQKEKAVLTAQGAKVTDSPVASGSNISQFINSPTLHVSLPVPILGTPARERYEEWRETIDEVHDGIEQIGYAFVPILATKAGDERCDYQAGIRRGNRVLHNRILIAESLEKSNLIRDWNELVQYAHARRGPRDRWEQDSPTMRGFDTKARAFQEKLMQVARADMSSAHFHAPIPLQNGRPDVRQEAEVATNSTRQSALEVVHTISRTINSENGEESFDEHRRVNANHPKLFLEYSNSIAAQYGMTFSGLSLKNDGGRAFNIEFGPEVRAGLTLQMDNPTRSVDKGEEYAIHLRVCEKKNEILYPIGGMLSGQVQTLFERLADKGNDEAFCITMKCADFDKHPFVSQFVLRWDIWTKRIWCERA